MSSRILFATLLCAALRAQTVPPEAVPPMDRPIQLPLSGRTAQPGAVVTVQNPLPAGLQSINTITSNVQVQGAYSGSVPTSQTPGPSIALSLDDAVRRGLQSNLGAIVNQQGVRVAEAMHARERSDLLPYVATNLLVSEQQTNLAALGFTGFPGVPGILGPFHYFDLRGGVTQNVFDLTRLRNYRASQENVRSARLNAEDARDLIVLAVTGAYLQVIAAGSRVETTRAQVATAQATYQQAVDRLAAGVTPRIDVTRTQVILQVNQQRQIALENDLAKLKIAFGRLIGLPPGQDFTLSDPLPFAPLAGITLDDALRRAFSNRADLKAADSQVHAAELARAAARAERYPTLQVSGDYGLIGASPQNSHGTFGSSAALRLPIFQGGRVQADIDLADAALQQRRAEAQDLRGRVDAEVRSAFLDLTSAANQIRVAESNRRLAAETLTQARDRFAAGVADTLEVVQAVESVAVAEQDYISSLYQHNLAKATIARAMGQADQNIRQFLGRP